MTETPNNLTYWTVLLYSALCSPRRQGNAMILSRSILTTMLRYVHLGWALCENNCWFCCKSGKSTPSSSICMSKQRCGKGLVKLSVHYDRTFTCSFCSQSGVFTSSDSGLFRCWLWRVHGLTSCPWPLTSLLFSYLTRNLAKIPLINCIILCRVHVPGVVPVRH